MPFTIDSVHVPMQNWQANAIKDGGFQNFDGDIPEEWLRRYPDSIGQGAVLTAYQDGDSVIWEGTLDADPEPVRGLAHVTATGAMQRAQRATGRRLYLTRDYSLWQDGGDEPMVFTPALDNIEAEVRTSQLFYRGFVDETYTTGDAHPLAMWAPGDLVTSYAFDIVKSGNTNDFELRMQRFTGPSGTRTLIEDIALTAGGPSARDVAITGAEDGLVANLRNVSGAAPAVNRKVRVKNLRVRGRASTDNMRTDQVIADVGAALGYDTTKAITTSTLDCMPLDWTSGTWLELMLYIASLEDWRVLILEDQGKGPVVDYGPWATTWKIRRSRHADPDLDALPLYNNFVVHYTDTAGAPLQVSTSVSVPSLTARNVTNTFEQTLSDPQADSTLAQSVLAFLAARYSVPRYQGPIDIVGATTPSGRPASAYEVRPGDLVEVGDWGPEDTRTLRVHEVTYQPHRVTLGIEAPVTIDGLVALYGLELARV